MTLLVTGGAGFVGSHVVRAAKDSGRPVVVLDDLSSGVDAPRDVPFVRGDIADHKLVVSVLRNYRVTACVHLAGKISIAESVTDPALYYDHNVSRTLALLDALRGRVGTFVFSSSAAVYGSPTTECVAETARLAPLSPYGATKVLAERELAARSGADGLRWAALRYFNAAGAHPDGTLVENHRPETHLIPLLVDAAEGRRPPVAITGSDYGTHDGTCIRDYIHVCDLAAAHIGALAALEAGTALGATNLGSGRGHSVREVLATAERVLGVAVPHSMSPRRPADPPQLLADIAWAERVLNWRPTRMLETIIEDTARSRRRLAH